MASAEKDTVDYLEAGLTGGRAKAKVDHPNLNCGYTELLTL